MTDINTLDALKTIAESAESLDNFIANLQNPYMPADVHISALKELLPKMANNLKKAYRAIDGGNPWEGSPFDIKED